MRPTGSLELRELLALPDWSATLASMADAAGLGYSSDLVLAQLRSRRGTRGRPGTTRTLDCACGVIHRPAPGHVSRRQRRRYLHDWFPYLEGYAPAFVRQVIHQFAPEARSILDPFAGAGTTPVVSALRGATRALYCEVNPVLQHLTAAKLDVLTWSAKTRVLVAERLAELARILPSLISDAPSAEDLRVAYGAVFGARRFLGDRTAGGHPPGEAFSTVWPSTSHLSRA